MRDLSLLIQQIASNPTAVLHGNSTLARELADAGSDGTDAVLKFMGGSWNGTADPRDALEALAYVWQLSAERQPSIVLELSRREGIPADPQLSLIAWSLWNAALRRRTQHLPIEDIESRLRELQSHPNEFVRWSARKGLDELASTT